MGVDVWGGKGEGRREQEGDGEGDGEEGKEKELEMKKGRRVGISGGEEDKSECDTRLEKEDGRWTGGRSLRLGWRGSSRRGFTTHIW